MEAVPIPCDIYEAAVESTISAAYYCNTSEVYPYETIPEDWIVVEDPIRSHISSIDAKYDPNLL